MLDSYIPPTAFAAEATGVVESLQPYNMGLHSGYEGSGGATGIDSFMEDLQNNYSQLIGTASALDLCNQSLLPYGVNNCSSANNGSNGNSTML